MRAMDVRETAPLRRICIARGSEEGISIISAEVGNDMGGDIQGRAESVHGHMMCNKDVQYWGGRSPVGVEGCMLGRGVVSLQERRQVGGERSE